MVFKKTKSIIVLGFTLILVIFAALVTVWVNNQQGHRDRLHVIDNLRQAAKSLGNMRQAALRRSLILHEMSLLDEFFDREDKHQEFVEQAGYFIQAREELLALDLTEGDRQLWHDLRTLITINAANQKHVADMLLKGELQAGRRMLSEEAIPKQQQIMDMLSGMLADHNVLVAKELSIADQEQGQAYRIIIMLAGLALCISIGIIIFIVRATTRIQNDLLKADEAHVANKMKSEFLATMSHEIRTPLTSIIGYSELGLGEDQDSEEKTDCLQSVYRNSKHLLRIINEILDLSKIEAGKLEMEILPVSMLEIMQDVNNVATQKAAEKNLKFGINYKYPLPEFIHTDPLRLKQILLNLAINAIKFTDEGHVYINVWCDRYEHKLYFEVEDSGIGIEPEQLDRIFAAFTQAEKNITRKYGGTGLGLTLSKRLASMLGGDLTVRSMPGHGSTFRVSVDTGDLRVADFIHQDPQQEDKPAEEKTLIPRLKGLVLLVDDVADNRKLFTHIISKTGAQVDVAENGMQVLEMVQFKHYDLVLMDMQMPVMDGLQATRLLREKGNTVPVVMLTANAYKSDRENCTQAGASGFLAKPVDAKTLHSVLADYLMEDASEKQHEPLYSRALHFDPELQEIIDNFVSYLPRQLENLEALLTKAAWDDLKFMLHSLKGSAGSLGFPQLADHVREMEVQIKEERYDQLETLMLELRHLVSRIDTPSDPVNDIA